MTNPVQPGDEQNQPQSPEQLSREQLEAQYNPQQPASPQQPTAPQQPHYQQPAAPQYQAPSYGQAPQQPYGQPQYQQYGQGQYQQNQYQQNQYQQNQYQQNQGQYQQPVVYGDPGVGEPFDGAASPDDLTRPLYGATFGQAVRRFFKNYVNFKGRASRSEYWWVQLFIALVYLVPTVVYVVGLFIMLGGSASSYDYSSGNYGNTGSDALIATGVVVLIVAGIIMVALSFGLLLPSIAIAWRRLHDANFAGPFFFLSLIPYAGGIVLIVFTILASKPEGRRFDAV